MNHQGWITDVEAFAADVKRGGDSQICGGPCTAQEIATTSQIQLRCDFERTAQQIFSIAAMP